ncbi:hypothetical protein Bbelb_329690 [Branchiostoma belcheri]|nr:hypothetical protein Bbelb_329690 [Branchiostoma belcheri]
MKKGKSYRLVSGNPPVPPYPPAAVPAGSERSQLHDSPGPASQLQEAEEVPTSPVRQFAGEAQVNQKTRRDKIRNEVIREMVGSTNVLRYIEHQRIKWFGHLVRLPPSQPAHTAYNIRGSGRRARGRPRRRWIDGVTETLSAHCLTLQQATRLAQNRLLHLPATPP